MSSISLTLGLRGRLLSGAQVTLQGALFGNNEPGLTFEPWDLTTLFQDRAGTTSVTAAGQSVGLRLDKSQGLRQGPERISNGAIAITGSATAATYSTLTGVGSCTRVDAVNQSYVAFTSLNATTHRIAITNTGSVELFIRAGTGLGAVSYLVAAGASITANIIATSGAFAVSCNTGTATFIVDSVRELSGNHQTAINDSARGIYGWMPKTGRRNLLTFTEQFDNAAWAKSIATASANSVTAPDGTTTADTVTATAGAGVHYVGQTVSITVATAYTLSVYAKAGTNNFIQLLNNRDTEAFANFDLGAGVVGTVGSKTVASIVSVGSGWYRCIATFSPVAALLTSFRVSLVPASSSAYSTAFTALGTETAHLWRAQLELGSTATAYQHVVSQYDITEAGVPTCYYVQADGIDDAYVTPTITPNTDKAQVFAGVRKLNDASQGCIMELGITAPNGSISLWAPPYVGGGFAMWSKGTLLSSNAFTTTPASPASQVVSGYSNISTDTAVLRLNGVQSASSVQDQGTGNYLNNPIYIYARGGTTLPFNGLDFGHAVRFGPNLDAATIARVESLIARNTPEVTL